MLPISVTKEAEAGGSLAPTIQGHPGEFSETITTVKTLRNKKQTLSVCHMHKEEIVLNTENVALESQPKALHFKSYHFS